MTEKIERIIKMERNNNVEEFNSVEAAKRFFKDFDFSEDSLIISEYESGLRDWIEDLEDFDTFQEDLEAWASGEAAKEKWEQETLATITEELEYIGSNYKLVAEDKEENYINLDKLVYEEAEGFSWEAPEMDNYKSDAIKYLFVECERLGLDCEEVRIGFHDEWKITK